VRVCTKVMKGQRGQRSEEKGGYWKQENLYLRLQGTVEKKILVIIEVVW
jgi:hypothetical protein